MNVNSERILFLNKIKKNKRIIFISRLSIIALLIIIWELLARFNLINTFLTSSPTDIIKTSIKLINDGSLFKHTFITLYEVILSFIISFSISLVISTLLWNNKTLAKVIDPYLTILNSLPKVALGPLIIILIGASNSSIIFMSLLISTFVTIINIYNSFVSTDKNYIVLLKSMKASKKDIFLKVILPSNFINIINSIKINISMNFIGVIMGELLVSKEGLGYLIMYGSQVFNINLVITSVVILGILSYLMYFIIDKIESSIRKKRLF